jgi:hypothetical protein
MQPVQAGFIVVSGTLGRVTQLPPVATREINSRLLFGSTKGSLLHPVLFFMVWYKSGLLQSQIPSEVQAVVTHVHASYTLNVTLS